MYTYRDYLHPLQFMAMLMHRFGTLAHIIASTDLICCKKPDNKMSEEELVMANAVEIAKELQAIRGIDEGTADDPVVRSLFVSSCYNFFSFLEFTQDAKRSCMSLQYE